MARVLFTYMYHVTMESLFCTSRKREVEILPEHYKHLNHLSTSVNIENTKKYSVNLYYIETSAPYRDHENNYTVYIVYRFKLLSNNF